MDYVRFLDVLSKEYGDKYSILNPYTKTWYNMNFTHISNSLKVSYEREYLKRWHGCPFMTGLDVYPYYYIPRNPNDENFIMDLLAKIDLVIGMNRQLMSRSDNKDISFQPGLLDRTVAVKLVELQRETGYEFNTERPLANQLEILYDQVCRLTPSEDADYVARYDEYAKDRSRRIPKDAFETIVCMPFEYTSMPVPIGYDYILKGRFGNGYIMPRRERGAHDYPYYRKQLDDREYYEAQIKEAGRNRYCTEIKKKYPAKRSVLYHTGMKEMLIHCDSAVEKIKNVIGYFREKEDTVELWWMPDVFLKSDEMAMDEVAPELMERYEAIINDHIKQGGNVCDIGTDIDSLIECCDEYYGDDGVIAERFKAARKNVTIQDYLADSIEIDLAYTGYMMKDKMSGETDQRIGKNIDKEECGVNITEEQKMQKIPETWKTVVYRKDGSCKKIILYVTSVSALVEYKEKLPDKIQSSLNIFREHAEDIALIWQIDPLIFETESVFNPDLIERMNSLVDEYLREKWGILCKEDTEEAIMLADAVYGDSDYIVAKCLKRELPVMIQDPNIIT